MMKDRKQDKTARAYLRQHHESASALIDAITFRKDRLLEVAEAVVERQEDFFDQGTEAMKILRMSELAEQFNCDPSTISRTVADKYVQSPRGIHPLREFFVGGTETSDGQSTSWDSVKARVQAMINEEDKEKPLSDDQVAKTLGKEGIELSRRTVAKYRQQLNIPPARQRKAY
jgi:RNA polymerase sigma-54 factor